MAHDRAQIIGLNQIIQSNFLVESMPHKPENTRFYYGPKGNNDTKSLMNTPTSRRNLSIINIAYDLHSDSSEE